MGHPEVGLACIIATGYIANQPRPQRYKNDL